MKEMRETRELVKIVADLMGGSPGVIERTGNADHVVAHFGHTSGAFQDQSVAG